MRFAYADPPYIGQAKRLYDCSEIDHAALIAQLETYDGWALSCSSTSLQYILSLCPKDVRIAVWAKTNPTIKKNVNPVYAWEPVIWKSPRKRIEQPYLYDWIATHATMFLKTPFVGSKTLPFCYWMFGLLNIQPGDTFDDLFPGTRAVSKAFEQWITAREAWAV